MHDVKSGMGCSGTLGILGHNHTDGSELTPLCHDWYVSCPKPIITHRCESLPLSVVTPLGPIHTESPSPTSKVT